MSEHPIDVLRPFGGNHMYLPHGNGPGCYGHCLACKFDAALRAVEQLEQAARNLDGYANDESGPYVLVRLDELRALTVALALFDRKEQT